MGSNYNSQPLAAEVLIDDGRPPHPPPADVRRPRPRRNDSTTFRPLELTMITIIDYGMGNLRSVQKAFEKVGHAAVVTSDPAQVAAAEKVVLPGVGAFEDAIGELRRLRLDRPVLDAIDSGKPFLGICLGLQLLFDVSYENGRHEGLGVLRGEVVRFELPDGFPFRIWAGTKCRSAARRPFCRASMRALSSTLSTRTMSCRKTRA